MSLAALLGFIVVAAEAFITPVPNDGVVHLPTVSFAQLTKDAAVLGAVTQEEPPTPQKPRKNVTIALLGDSMVDTLGPDMPELTTEISSRAAHITPKILNYGVGGTNIDYGIERITHDYNYLGTHIPSLASQRPNIVIIESFGYNPYPFDTGAIDKHWLALAAAVDSIKATIPQAGIVIASTIAPNAGVFGDGAPGVAFTPQDKQQRVTVIKHYLESTVKFALSQKLPLVDAFHDSLNEDGNGKLEYINSSDHIHTSAEGRKYFAKKIADTLFEAKLLE